MDNSRLIIGISDIIIGLFFIALAVPLMRRRMPRDGAFGFRIRKAYQSDDNWYAINEYGGRRLLIWAFPVVICGFIALLAPISHTALGWFSYAPLIILAPIVETFYYARQL